VALLFNIFDSFLRNIEELNIIGWLFLKVEEIFQEACRFPDGNETSLLKQIPFHPPKHIDSHAEVLIALV